MLRIIMLLLILCLANDVFTQDTADYDQLSDQAWEMYESGELKQAALLYERLATTYEQDRGENYYIAACCASFNGDKEEALTFLEKSVDYGFWQFVDLYETDTDLESLHELAGWQNLMTSIYAKADAYVASLKEGVRSFTHDESGKSRSTIAETKLRQLEIQAGQQLFESLEDFRVFGDYSTDSTTNLCFWLPYKDRLEAPFLVQLPAGFSNEKPHPVLFQLHGGVRHINGYPAWLGEDAAGGWNRYFSSFADSNSMIMVYPQATSEHNWMTPGDGFDLLPLIIRQLKLMLNVDENRIYLSGHSNGATGSFSYAVKHTTPFARFFGLNTHPKVYTGGTFIRNLQNTHFHAISTDQDYYYPQSGIERLLALSEKHGLGFSNSLYQGFPHWFPDFDESKPAIAEIFDQAKQHSRNPFLKELYWECDELDNGRVHWLQITRFDTLQTAAQWHENINYTVSDWVDVDDETQTIPDYEEAAFDYPRRSAAVRAKVNGNKIELQTSRVGELRLLLHPQLVDISQPLEVWVNGSLAWKGIPGYDTEFMLKQFAADLDRTTVWVNKIDLLIKE